MQIGEIGERGSNNILNAPWKWDYISHFISFCPSHCSAEQLLLMNGFWNIIYIRKLNSMICLRSWQFLTSFQRFPWHIFLLMWLVWLKDHPLHLQRHFPIHDKSPPRPLSTTLKIWKWMIHYSQDKGPALLICHCWNDFGQEDENVRRLPSILSAVPSIAADRVIMLLPGQCINTSGGFQEAYQRI